MSPGGLKLFFRMGMFITVVAFFLVLNVPRDSAEFVISVLSLVIGLTLLGLIALVSWWSQR